MPEPLSMDLVRVHDHEGQVVFIHNSDGFRFFLVNHGVQWG